VFDLCSGRGGDLFKWLKAEPSHYVALEYQESLIDKAVERFKKARAKFPGVFIVADAGDPNTTIDQILNTHEEVKDFGRSVVFDIVSCQFSMHYLFESEVKLRAFLRNVTSRLEPGGFFIGTTVDAEKVVSVIRESGNPELSVSNKFFSI
jgi:mRNA (guanine-N7-)-methyltransferase